MFGGKPSNKVKEIWQQIHQQKVTDSNLIETTIKQKETMTGSKKSPTNMDTKTLDQNNQINVDKSTQDTNKNKFCFAIENFDRINYNIIILIILYICIGYVLKLK